MEWQTFIEHERTKEYFQTLEKFVTQRRGVTTVYPNSENVFYAFEQTPLSAVKVVIVGQDPYHQVDQAHGLSFSVQKGVKIPPSLMNIYKELQDDLGIPIASHGDLTYWATQGVLLLNTVLTVEDSKPNSHQHKGWEQFTDRVIQALDERVDPVIFVLWGKQAQEKERLITQERHMIIRSSHPSPLSAYRGFFGSRPFSGINAQLRRWEKEPIDFNVSR